MSSKKRFKDVDPKACAFFLAAVERTAQRRRTTEDDRATLQSLLQTLPDAIVESGQRQRRGIDYCFEGFSDPMNEIRYMMLEAGPNYPRRWCMVGVDANKRALEVELGP